MNSHLCQRIQLKGGKGTEDTTIWKLDSSEDFSSKALFPNLAFSKEVLYKKISWTNLEGSGAKEDQIFCLCLQSINIA